METMVAKTALSILMAMLILSGSPMIDGNPAKGGLTIEGIPEDGILINPLNATVIFEEEDRENWTVKWYLDGKEVHEGHHIQRYIYPGMHNLTIICQRAEGEVRSASFFINPLPPPGWGEQPDQYRNEMIFWAIFISGGLIFAIAIMWIHIGKIEGMTLQKLWKYRKK